ncbi:peptidyl-tRNA hydrolase, chloroplastic isoform X2 [Rhodamnia argentea]|uniref:peptidyl-tRNA hydrolase n=1 Tax=Rhodamnia argentea TaxID=178133 RepID=A0A8B8PL02_9MYRT|nr:peptidyl-tRNA hydrolase, chloroplastic isoform X2 [Rhodamnia argentea]
MRVGAIASSVSALRFPIRHRLFLSSNHSHLAGSLPLRRARCPSGRRTMSEQFSSPFSSSSAPIASLGRPVDGDIEAKKPPQQHPWLIVGLGNPGKRFHRKCPSHACQTTNIYECQWRVGPIASYYKIPLKQVLVVFDDLDLPFAKLRLLPKGGHGGHNGMRSVINHLKGSRDFPRLRIGIGRPPGKMDPVNFVMRPFNKQEREELDYTFQQGLAAMRILLLEGFDKSATFVNSNKSLEQLS